jgi:hypothetical protein
MSSTVVAKNLQVGADGTASNNFTIYQPASPDGTLRIGNGNTGTTSAQVVLTSAGNVGIGTSSPTFRLSVKQSGNTSFASFGIASINSANDTYLGMGYDANSDTHRISATFQSTGAYKPISFWTSDTERMRINAGAPILCLAGGNTSATGTGIAFPATQSASSDANTLDDYEEGTWAPTLRFNSGQSGNFTFSQNLATYIKIGRLVHVQGWIQWSGKPSSGNDLSIDFPFVSPPEQSFRGGVNITYADNPPFTGLTLYGFAIRTEASETRGTINIVNSTSGSMAQTVSAANVNNAGSFMFSGTFVTAA